MPKDIRAFLRKKPTGEQIGRLMIEDLVLSYDIAQSPAQPHDALLTPEEKTALVESLTKPTDITKYTEYRYIHESLLGAQTTAVLQINAMEAMACQLQLPLEMLREAELEHAQTRAAPQIMTQAQYDAAKAAGVLPPGGAAVLVDGPADYAPAPTYLFARFSAEPFLAKYGADFSDHYQQYLSCFRTYFAVQAAVELIGRFIKVPQVTRLIPPLDAQPLAAINGLLEQLPALVTRADEDAERALRARLRGFCLTTPLDDLRPTEEQIGAVYASMDASFFQGNMQRLYAMLTRGATP